MEKLKEKAGASYKKIVHNIKEEAKYRKAAQQNIKRKEKAAFWKEKERMAVKKAKAKARGGNGLAQFVSGGPSVGKKQGSGFSMDIDMGMFDNSRKKKKNQW